MYDITYLERTFTRVYSVKREWLYKIKATPQCNFSHNEYSSHLPTMFIASGVEHKSNDLEKGTDLETSSLLFGELLS